MPERAGRVPARSPDPFVDAGDEPAFDRLTGLASRLLDVPIAIVSLVAGECQYFKSCVGLPEPWATNREASATSLFCADIMQADGPVLVPNARVAAATRRGVMLAGVELVAYAGVALATSHGEPLGAFIVIDRRTREWSAQDAELLVALARAAACEIELRRESAERVHGDAVLRYSEECFRTTFERAGVGIAHATMDGMWLRANETFRELTGYTEPELRAMSFRDLTHPKDIEIGVAQRARLWNGEIESYTREKRYVRKDGHVFWANVTVSLARTARATPDYFILTVEDISARKAVELERQALLADRTTALTSLLDWERRFRALLSHTSDAILICDADGRICYASPTYERVLGYVAEDLVGASATDIVHEDDRAAAHTMIERSLAAPGAEVRSEFRCRHRDGSWRTLAVMAKNLLEDPAIGGIVASAHDMTERSAAERELQRAHETLATLINTAPVAIVTTDADYIVRGWNPAAERMFGWCAEEVIGKPVMYVPADRQAESDAVRRDAALGHVKGFETRRSRKDGTLVDVYLSVAPLRTATGAVEGVVAFLFDVTDRQQLAEQLRQAQKMEAVGRLAGGIAHDFNNLLTVIKCHGEFLREDLDQADPRMIDVTQIGEAAERAAGLTRQLLAFSRKQMLQPRVLDLNAVVAGLEPLLRRLIGEDIEIATVAAPSIGRVLADPGQLEQVLVNLAVNARDAMPDGGVLVFETSVTHVDAQHPDYEDGMQPGDYVTLTVADSGVGMNDAVQARVFEPFFTTKAPGQGTGLGLSTVYGIVKQSGGYIRVRSQEAKGTTFRILLPMVSESGAPAHAPSAESEFARGSETVLVVEDEEAVRGLACRILRRQGYTVLEARHGADGLHLALEYPKRIDLVLTDLVMPEMSGRALVERLSAARPDLRVLYMSGYTDDDIIRRGLLESDVNFLPKPFTAAQLTLRVREMLDEA